MGIWISLRGDDETADDRRAGPDRLSMSIDAILVAPVGLTAHLDPADPIVSKQKAPGSRCSPRSAWRWLGFSTFSGTHGRRRGLPALSCERILMRLASAVSSALVVCILSSVPAAAAVPHVALVKDINETPIDQGSTPIGFAALGDDALFSAFDQDGAALWRTNGTEEGTVAVKRLLGDGFAVLDGVALFISNSGGGSDRLWRTDGTEAGTFSLTQPGTSSPSSVAGLVAFSGAVYFTAQDGSHGAELWRSDGTPAGTQMVADIVAGAGSSSPSQLTVAGGRLFFAATTPASGRELWSTDGTAAGTAMAADIRTGSTSSSPNQPIAVGSSLFFIANDGSHGTELWTSDGTPAGTRLVKDIVPGTSGLNGLSARSSLDGSLIFTLNTSRGVELWRSDGTEAGTALVTIVTTPSLFKPLVFTEYQGALFFIVNRVSVQQIWRTDGTAAGTQMVVDGLPGNGGDLLDGFLRVGPVMVFFGGGLWVCDGTPEGTFVLSPTGVTAVKRLGATSDRVYFVADDGLHGGEPWVSDGTIGGTHLLRDIKGGPDTSHIASPVSLGDAILFSADDEVTGAELWRSDGTKDGTTVIADMNPGPGGSNPSFLTRVGGLVYFAAADPQNDLWVTDGTPAGTRRVRGDGSAALNPSDLAAMGDTVFFAGDEAFVSPDQTPAGPSLWKSDGTAAGTVLVAPLPVRPTLLKSAGPTLFFVLPDLNGPQLWASNGTAEGTRALLPSPTLATATLCPSDWVAVGNRLFFAASTSGFDCELWQSDGTNEGTVQVADLRTDGTSSNPSPIGSLGDVLLFWADDGVHAPGLWRSDGTAEGTSFVAAMSFVRQQPVTLNGVLYFASGDSGTGYELFQTDGTAAGTLVVADINPGDGSSWPRDLVEFRGFLMFGADDGVHGVEPWISDGTAAGTRLLADVLPGPGHSLAGQFVATASRVFFTADDGVVANELWSFSNEAPVAVAGPDVRVETPRSVTLDASGSRDPEDDPLRYEWKNASGAVVGSTPVVTLPLGPGSHSFTLTVTDSYGATAQDGVTVEVLDRRLLTLQLSSAAGALGGLLAQPLSGEAPMLCTVTALSTSTCTRSYPFGTRLLLVPIPGRRASFEWTTRCSRQIGGVCVVQLTEDKVAGLRFFAREPVSSMAR
jgi:ELWxxDGT repeat protein